MEIVTEIKNLKNLHYVRELAKYDLDQWVEDKKDGQLKDRKEAMEIIEDIAFINDAISGLYSIIKDSNENRTNGRRTKVINK